jgi:hypothetical protein
VLAGGSRKRLLILPPHLAWVRPIRHVGGYLRVETFPGAACYTARGSAMIFRAILPAVGQQSKAAPLQALGTGKRLDKAWRMSTIDILTCYQTVTNRDRSQVLVLILDCC